MDKCRAAQGVVVCRSQQWKSPFRDTPVAAGVASSLQNYGVGRCQDESRWDAQKTSQAMVLKTCKCRSQQSPSSVTLHVSVQSFWIRCVRSCAFITHLNRNIVPRTSMLLGKYSKRTPGICILERFGLEYALKANASPSVVGVCAVDLACLPGPFAHAPPLDFA